ncbi:HEPN domain-containing protein [Synechococcus elongatus]|uniref:HEPN domain-containing protein n=1 Tax=Synechococcus elongatus PCC 11801 TaxID=2219813 RepID=A0AAN1QM67_SYNEL|nr:HEPN domain-containing protein [Synechococcus elongatus]AZB71730.1 hypothetical protein DOP62_02440 [Synechococcus elongatus PCC 11801]
MAKSKKNQPQARIEYRIAKILRDLAAQTECPPSSLRAYPPQLVNGVAFYLPEGIRWPPDQILEELFKREGYKERFSSKFLGDQISNIFSKFLIEEILDIEKSLEDLIKELDNYSEERIILIRIEGILLHKICFDLGRVRLSPGDDSLLEEITEITDKVIDLTLMSEEEKSYSKYELRQQYLERMKGACIAVVKVGAEPIRAIEVAKEEVRRSMDLLRLGIKAIQGINDRSRIGIAGDHPTARVEALAISELNLNNQIDLVGHPLQVNNQFVDELEKLELFLISEALRKEKCTDLEEAIIRSIHWFSVAVCQDEKSNAFLLLVVSLEVLFKPNQGSSIASTVAESIAFLLARTKEERLETAKLVRKFYGMRSSVAHSGRSSFSEKDLYQLMIISMEVILETIHRSIETKSQKELMEEIELIKFS